MGFVPGSSYPEEPLGGAALNRNSEKPTLITSLLCSGLYPNFAERGKKKIFRTKEDKTTLIHPNSVNYKPSDTGSPWFVFQEKVKTNQIFLKSTSQVPSVSILLFGGILDTQKGGSRTLIMDEWMIFSCKGEDAMLIIWLRKFLDAYLWRCYANPQKMWSYSMENPYEKLEQKILASVIGLLSPSSQ